MHVHPSMLGLLAVLLFGCGARQDYYVSGLALERDGWDTLRVEAHFAQRTTLGGPRAVRPQALMIHLFSAAFDTLYAGPATTLPVPDADLGDRELLMVEVCGTFGARAVCEQQGVPASPKRVRVAHDIVYPEAAGYARGSYRLQFAVERERYEGDAWEPVARSARVGGYLLAYVDGDPAHAVRVPVTRAEGRFDLSRQRNYKDFAYRLRSRLLDTHEASVHFDVYAGLSPSGTPVRLASVAKQLRTKTEADRVEEVRYFTEQAVTQVLDALRGTGGNVRAYIDTWTFDALERRYEVALEVVWHTGPSRRDRHILKGAMEVAEDGADGRFTLHDGNRRAERIWRRRIDGKQMPLAPMETVETRAPNPLEPGGVEEVAPARPEADAAP